MVLKLVFFCVWLVPWKLWGLLYMFLYGFSAFGVLPLFSSIDHSSLSICKSLDAVSSNFSCNCYLTASQPTLGHFWWGILTNLMLITAFLIYFDPKVTRSLIARLDSKAWLITNQGLNRDSLGSECNALIHYAIRPKLSGDNLN